MQITRSKIQYLPTIILIIVAMVVWVLGSSGMANADMYTDSAHGNTDPPPGYGVNRSGTECPTGTPCPTGDCAHCHDTFNDSICGVNQRMLFATQFTNQRGALCMRCHSSGAYCEQDGGFIINYDYSRARGGETGSSSECPDNIRMAFKFINYDTRLPQTNCDLTEPIGSAHDLKNIRGYMKNKWGWGGTDAEVNPCGACHNPHQATKEYPCSLPSSHSGTWEIWGDENGEKMADYLGDGEIYQPPYKIPEGEEPPEEPQYERDADTLPNYVEFCLECHQDQQNSLQHGTVGGVGAGSGIDWSASGSGGAAVHGKFHEGSHTQGSLAPPYDDPDANYVLSCTDCHEPHGSRNEWLLRTEVNGKTGIEVNEAGDWLEFCTACHVLTGCRHIPCPDPCGGSCGYFLEMPCNNLECHMHGSHQQPL